MIVKINKLKTYSDKVKCYVHARGMVLPTGFGIMTMQRLELSGCDVFYGLEMIKTNDGGVTWSAPVNCKNLDRQFSGDGKSVVFCDATPFYHKKSGRIILTGHTALYDTDNKLAASPRPRVTAYAVYNETTGDFDAWKALEMPKTDDDRYFSAGAGCSQIVELKSGGLLIPIYYLGTGAKYNNGCSSVAVLHCKFDGEKIGVIEIGNELTCTIPRGFGEPSIVSFRKEYFLALRNDQTGFVAKSADGLHFSEPRELVFDNGETLGNYNTQQHWLTGGGKLWLVYTRRAGHNNHIFRHRAPLFIAEFDPDKMCIIRATEQIAVPERGARLGNFGCQSYSDECGFVFAAEWMQNDPHGWDECAKYGSDNSIFISKIIY